MSAATCFRPSSVILMTVQVQRLACLLKAANASQILVRHRRVVEVERLQTFEGGQRFCWSACVTSVLEEVHAHDRVGGVLVVA